MLAASTFPVQIRPTAGAALSIAFDSRPSRAEIEPVALDLIQRRGSEVLGIARRYACSPEDAEDAYQRALEILLTKAPTTRADDLLPWLKTVVKHEAFALRKKRERDVPAEHDALDAFADDAAIAADERAERYDRLRVGAEALGRLKPQETRALLLKAEGLSYQEIAAQTGWTYTKVNRCLTEGRRAFFSRVEGIESGAECDRLAPLLSALADGEASAEDMAALRPHLRGCAACRATLRDYREAPRRVAGLAAPVAAGGVLAWLGERVYGAAGWLRSLVEGAAAHKAAAVAASAVAVAGGGAATIQAVEREPERRAATSAVSLPAVTPAKPSPPVARPARKATPKPRPRAKQRPRTAARAARATASATAPPQRAPDPAPSARAQQQAPPAPAPAPTERAAAGPTPAAEPPQGAGEFGP